MRIIFAVLLAIIVSGCDSKPGDGIIKKHIVSSNNEQYNTLGLGKIVSIKNIKVINGFEKLIEGSPSYVTFVEYDLVFLKEPKEIITELQNMAKSADKITKDSAGIRDALNKISRAGMLLQTLVEMSLSESTNKSNTIQETFILKKGDKGWFVTSSEPGWTEMQ
ncbi:MAG TPA: hypothetical protein PLZ43_11880 [bacterium]|nr:hypothetical protein [bacterium]